MRIDGQNPSISVGKAQSLSVLSELNLKDGRKVTGRIISLSAGEALLDLDGRVLTAKIEGNPRFVTPGAVLSFKVNADSEGKIQLKVLNPVTGQTASSSAIPVPSESNSSSNEGSAVPSSEKGVNQIINALLKNDLPALPENIARIARLVQTFQMKYRLPLTPETAAFVTAQNWPATDGVLLTALLLQDRNLRNQLWNALQQMSVEYPEIAQTLADLKLNMEEDAAPIIAKFKQLNAGIQSGELNSDAVPEISSSLIPGKKAALSAVQANNPREYGKETGPIIKELNTSLVPERLTPGKDAAPEAPPPKILALLEQNLDLQKALHNPPGGLYNMIPLLIRDSRNNLHECFVEWRSEPRRQGKNVGEQHLSFVIPTENMGMIRMSVGIGTRTTIALKVGSTEVKEFLSRHTELLCESIAAPAAVTISLDEEKTAELQFNGVDMKL